MRVEKKGYEYRSPPGSKIDRKSIRYQVSGTYRKVIEVELKDLMFPVGVALNKQLHWCFFSLTPKAKVYL
jgi:hypothetical protein